LPSGLGRSGFRTVLGPDRGRLYCQLERFLANLSVARICLFDRIADFSGAVSDGSA